MPNYNLGSRFPDVLTHACAGISRNCVQHAQAGFPLTSNEIERAVCEPDVLERLQWLRHKGVGDLPGVSVLSFVLDPDKTPGLSRTMAFEVRLDRRIFKTQPAPAIYIGEYKTFDTSKIPTQTFTFPPEKNEALVKWAHRVLKEERLKVMCDKTVDQVVGACKTTNHIMARWPFLATVVPEWREKFQNPTKKLKPWAPREGWLMLYKKRMEASEVVLNKGLFLGDYKVGSNPGVTARIAAYERLANDPNWDKLPQ